MFPHYSFKVKNIVWLCVVCDIPTCYVVNCFWGAAGPRVIISYDRDGVVLSTLCRYDKAVYIFCCAVLAVRGPSYVGSSALDLQPVYSDAKRATLSHLDVGHIWAWRTWKLDRNETKLLTRVVVWLFLYTSISIILAYVWSGTQWGCPQYDPQSPRPCPWCNMTLPLQGCCT